ncbi:hypothetical protein, partial [Bacillus cereus]|uniref:hypothetical protein n=2 Tax=Bacillus TaxID=1386 RepID=UPI000BF3F655
IMDLYELEKKVAQNTSIFYGRNLIQVIRIYEIFNLVDIVYNGESTVFTVDIMTLDYSPSTENTIRIF